MWFSLMILLHLQSQRMHISKANNLNYWIIFLSPQIIDTEEEILRDCHARQLNYESRTACSRVLIFMKLYSKLCCIGPSQRFWMILYPISA